jgi:hypothetical protein
MSAQKNRKPTAKEQGRQKYIQVERGIYRYKDREGEFTYHERPWIISRKGKPVRTYRSLGHGFTRQTNLASARLEYQRRQVEVADGRNPYEEKQEPEKQEQRPQKLKVEEIVRMYVEKKYPDRYLRPRTGRTLESEKGNCKRLLECCAIGMPWHDQPWDSLIPGNWDDYHEWRLEQINGKEDEEEDEKVDLEPEEPRGTGLWIWSAIH